MASEGHWYFGYGSNMHRTIFVERRRMSPLATLPASLDGYRLCFNLPIGPGERGVANIVAEPGERVWGVLYLLTPEDCARLDQTEGVHLGYYRRTDIEVTADAHGSLDAFSYHSPVSVEGRKPSARYMRLLLEGARHHRLPDDYVRLLEAFPLAVDERELARQEI